MLLCIHTLMSRATRPHLPGVAFHITARTQNKAPWFAEVLRNRIVSIITEGITCSDATLLAYAVMPNHLHIVIQQGHEPLGQIMQPILRRIALLVQRRNGQEGHVFERRFRSHPCADADYLRRTIAYTHLNPVRAGLCENLSYPWTSHTRYLLDDTLVRGIEIAHVLRLFAETPDGDTAMCRLSYLNYMEWRLEKDQCDVANTILRRVEPLAMSGNQHFAAAFCQIPVTRTSRSVDLRDRAEALLLTIDPNLDVNALRKRTVSRQQSMARTQLIAGLRQSGYSGRRIAEFLRISQSTVSTVSTQMRYARIGKLHSETWSGAV